MSVLNFDLKPVNPEKLGQRKGRLLLLIIFTAPGSFTVNASVANNADEFSAQTSSC